MIAKTMAEWLLIGYVPVLALIKGIIYYIHTPRL
ncbi:hypothetical protein C8P63_1202 [Melghirimyces profundicolus]|uniref:Uncharacterized protein n=1 Tax=Melghirimyces profundicolus TaxID=1242148 RepID=A0A2T6BGL9_9BACL|nr:hypothetical protein C8P63_1202 [Melghirimyces profundicolus]